MIFHPPYILCNYKMFYTRTTHPTPLPATLWPPTLPTFLFAILKYYIFPHTLHSYHSPYMLLRYTGTPNWTSLYNGPPPTLHQGTETQRPRGQSTLLVLNSYATENGLRNHKVRFCKTLKQQTAAANEKQGVPSEPATSETANSEPAIENNTCPKCKAEFHSRSSLGLHVLTHF
jgi:hypothetical protein